MNKRFLLVSCTIFLSLALAATASAQYVVDLPIPLYGQENSMYGGPACAQMIMDGYPPPGTPIYVAQSVIWTSIQSHNSGEPGWATDPQGMRGALLELNPPPVGTWSLMSYDVREDLMFQILFWMNYNSYAVPTLVNSGYHWVDVVGYETDVEPVWGSDPVLQEITINDPWPIGVGQVSTMTGTVWYDTKWNLPIGIAGTWFEKYVAIIEPPETEGEVTIEPLDRRGITPISSEDARLLSENWIDTMLLAEKHPSYAKLDDSDTNNLEPILVREEIHFGITKDASVPYYYIIPYATKDDNPAFLDNGSETREYASLNVIINAFSGAFEEVGSFGRPISYLDEEEAIAAAARALKLEVKDIMAVAEAIMVYTPCSITYSRTYPFWRVDIKGVTRYVDHEARVYTLEQIIPQLYGR